jgi:hypothetical protein
MSVGFLVSDRVEHESDFLWPQDRWARLRFSCFDLRRFLDAYSLRFLLGLFTDAD